MTQLRRIEPAEATQWPWWAVIDPDRVRSHPGRTNEQRIQDAANAVVGPFTSRESAEEHLRVKAHHYSARAVVFCMSGYASADWRDLCEEAPRPPVGKQHV